MSEQGFVTVADDVYQRACVTTVEEGLARAEEIGYPVMIKASEGGGGKGIRKVEAPEAFKNAFNAVAGEIPGMKHWLHGSMSLILSKVLPSSS